MKTALITGASGGIGYEFARIFARQQNNLILVARSGNRLAEIKQELEASFNIQVRTVALDLGKPESAAALMHEIGDTGIDYLVNNAGFGDFGEFHQADWDKTTEMIQLNITTLTQLTRLVLPQMVARKSGRILNVASTAAFQPGPLMAVYYATKSYVLSFSEAIARELKSIGVSVTALCPGPTESGFQAKADLGESKLVKGKKLPSAQSVAEAGYKAMMRGKTVLVPGLQNQILAASPRFLPRDMVTKIVMNVQARSH